jgi:hypothetical protein
MKPGKPVWCLSSLTGQMSLSPTKTSSQTSSRYFLMIPGVRYLLTKIFNRLMLRIYSVWIMSIILISSVAFIFTYERGFHILLHLSKFPLLHHLTIRSAIQLSAITGTSTSAKIHVKVVGNMVFAVNTGRSIMQLTTLSAKLELKLAKEKEELRVSEIPTQAMEGPRQVLDLNSTENAPSLL